MEEHQSKAKETEEEAVHYQKKAMSLQQKIMIANFKPILVIMIFSILFFPWVRATYSPTVQMNKTGNHTYQGKLTYAGRQDKITVIDTSSPIIEAQGQKAEIGEPISDVGVKWQVQNFKKEDGGQKANLGLNADFLDIEMAEDIEEKVREIKWS